MKDARHEPESADSSADSTAPERADTAEFPVAKPPAATHEAEAPTENEPEEPEAEPTTDDASTEETPEDERPSDEDEPGDETPSAQSPADEDQAAEAPADETPAAESPADETPTDETPTDEDPTDEVPTDQSPADEPQADERPADETTADEGPEDDEPSSTPGGNRVSALLGSPSSGASTTQEDLPTRKPKPADDSPAPPEMGAWKVSFPGAVTFPEQPAEAQPSAAEPPAAQDPAPQPPEAQPSAAEAPTAERPEPQAPAPEPQAPQPTPAQAGTTQPPATEDPAPQPPAREGTAPQPPAAEPSAPQPSAAESAASQAPAAEPQAPPGRRRAPQAPAGQPHRPQPQAPERSAPAAQPPRPPASMPQAPAAWASPQAPAPQRPAQDAEPAATTQIDIPMRPVAPTVETPLYRTPPGSPTPAQEWRASAVSAPPVPSSRDSGQWSVPWSQGTQEQQEAGPEPQAQPGQEYPLYQDYEPQEVAEEAPRKRGKKRALLIALIVVVLLAGGAVAGQLLRPLPEPTVSLTLPSATHTFAGAKPTLAWPTTGQSTLYVDGIGTMGAAGSTTPIPTASVAKTMTAYVFLKSHPLKSGQSGPTYTVSPQAAARVIEQKRRGESLLEVTANQRLTQRKALEALMIISANDVAHELARWDSGDEATFVAKMNAAARQLGMTDTHYTDPSGYQSTTVSTAADQVKLLRAAMKIPAFAETVAKRTYVPDPGGGEMKTGGNLLLGQLGVVGGKTGYTDAAGGNYIFAARKRVGGVSTLIVGAVMGQPTQAAAGAIDLAKNLLATAENSLTAATLAPAGAKVAEVNDGLGGVTPLTAKTPLTVVGWPGLTVPVKIKADSPPNEAAAGTRLGTVTAGPAKAPLVLGSELAEPSIVTRLTRLTD